MVSWYDSLNKPALTPPDWIFSPVWGLLYATIAVSIAVFYLSPPKHKPKYVTLILVLHLVTNFIWTPLFFGLHSPGWALVDIIMLDSSLIYIIWRFWQINKFASAILIPYLIWVLFATYLNFGFFILN